MAGDALAVVVSVLVALRVRAFVADDDFTPQFVLPQTYWFFVLAGLWFLLASANDYYDLRIAASRIQSLQRLIFITLRFWSCTCGFLFSSQRGAAASLHFVLRRRFIHIGYLWRVLNPALIGWASEPRRVLIVGTDWAAQTIIESIRNQGEGAYEIKGIIGEPGEVGRTICGTSVIGTGDDVLNFVLRDRITELVVTSTRELSGITFQGDGCL
jgi:FlaA1/EpsC-like NDP-sugar epimerase